MTRIVVVLLMLLSVSAHAVPDAQVQAVQMPAWLQRGEHVEPLRVGVELRNGDKLITGEQARIYVKTADGSTIKLGEKASLTLGGLSQQRDAQSLFEAAINVAKGAFRFTTAAAAKLRPRDVTIKVANATIGIRGTDVWGKDDEAMGVVCLIEGKIDVTGADKQTFVMDQPLSFYNMPKGAMPLPVGPVDAKQLAQWATETDITQPAAQIGGVWKVDLLTATDQQSALDAYDKWRGAGFDVRIQPVAYEGGWHYRVRLTQIATRAEAQQLAEQLKGKLGAENPSASR